MAKWEILGIGAVGAAVADKYGASSRGHVDSSSNDFVGVDIGNVQKYVTDIVASKIKTTATAVLSYTEVFTALESGWSGIALKNFEENFITAAKALVQALNAAYAALLDEIVGIINGMVQQDQEMIQKY